MRQYFLLVFFLFPALAYAQFDRINTNPVIFHPSLAGSTGESRIATEGTLTPVMTGQTVTSSAGYDVFSKKLKGGVGFNFSYSDINRPEIYHSRSFEFTGAYAPKFTFNENITWSPSISFSHQYNKNEHTHPRHPSEEKLNQYTLGLMVNTESFFIGADAGFVQQWYPSFDGAGKDVEKLRFNAVGGYNFNRNPERDLSSTVIAGYHTPVTNMIATQETGIRLGYYININRFILGYETLRGASVGFKSGGFSVIGTASVAKIPNNINQWAAGLGAAYNFGRG